MRAFSLLGSRSAHKVVPLNNPSKDKRAHISKPGRETKIARSKTCTGTECLLISCAQRDEPGENMRTKTVSCGLCTWIKTSIEAKRPQAFITES